MEGSQAQKMTFTQGIGVLYIVGTPIGNLGDITPRAREILDTIEFVVCEDTRRTSRLLAALGLRARLISCFEHKEARCAEEVMGLLLSGVDCAFLTDAGTPNVSDPGRRLIKACFQNGVRVVPIPGPSAVTTIMSCAPFEGSAFHFAGFLPERSTRRRKVLEGLRHLACPVVFFEAPHRVLESLKDVLSVMGDRQMLMGRELTKMHEEILLGSVSQVIKHLESKGVRGEFTFCIQGKIGKKGAEHLELDQEKLAGVVQLIDAIRGGDIHTKALAAALSRLTGTGKGVLYNLLVKHLRGQHE